jgi:hypothetical protein
VWTYDGQAEVPRGDAVSDDTQWTGDVPAKGPGADHATAEQTHLAPSPGSSVVDGVLASLDGLEERPVGDHVAVFEAAHEQLRAALADAGDRAAG